PSRRTECAGARTADLRELRGLDAVDARRPHLGRTAGASGQVRAPYRGADRLPGGAAVDQSRALGHNSRQGSVRRLRNATGAAVSSVEVRARAPHQCALGAAAPAISAKRRLLPALASGGSSVSGKKRCSLISTPGGGTRCWCHSRTANSTIWSPG